MDWLAGARFDHRLTAHRADIRWSPDSWVDRGCNPGRVALGPRQADRWPNLRGRMIWASVVLAVLGVLVASVRNTPFGVAPVLWISLAPAWVGLFVAMVGTWRGQHWRWWLVPVLTAGVLAGVTLDGFGPLGREAVEISKRRSRSVRDALHAAGSRTFPAGGVGVRGRRRTWSGVAHMADGWHRFNRTRHWLSVPSARTLNVPGRGCSCGHILLLPRNAARPAH